MSGNIRFIAIAVLLVVAAVVAVGLYLWMGGERTPKELPPRPTVVVPDAIPVQEVTVQSTEIDLELTAMRGNVHPDYTDWTCILECRELEGCRADVEVVVEFRSSGEPRQLTIGGRLFGDPGEVMRIGRVQRPPVNVDGIDRVTINVLHIYDKDGPQQIIID
jgi:hypothetical protein